VRVRHAPRIEGRRAATESGPQTGDARAVSYPRLVLDRHNPETAHQLLLNVIEFDLERGAAQREDRGRHVDELAVGQLPDKGLVAGLFGELRDTIHGPVQVPNLPVGSSRCTMKNLNRTVGIDVQLKDGRALGTESPFIMRAAGIAFDIHDLTVFRVNERSATHGTIGADTRRHLGVFYSELLGLCDNRS